MDAATARAVGYVRSVRPHTATAITFDKHLAGTWRRLAPDIPISVETRKGALAADVRKHLQKRRKAMRPHEFLTIVVPELLERRGLMEILRRPRMHRFKASFLREPGVQVLDIPMLRDEIDPEVDESVEPARNYVIVLVSGVHNATLEAIEYAESLRGTSVQAVMFRLDPSATEKIGNEWMGQAIPVPLEIEDSPFRDIGYSLTQYVRAFRPDAVDRMVTVVIPEFVVSKLRHQLLHGQTALIVKRHLLFEPGVVVASVPYQLES
jgi:hypothetical protein